MGESAEPIRSVYGCSKISSSTAGPSGTSPQLIRRPPTSDASAYGLGAPVCGVACASPSSVVALVVALVALVAFAGLCSLLSLLRLQLQFPGRFREKRGDLVEAPALCHRR